MSLVNQMLKDLEQRRAELPSGDRLRGLRSAPATDADTQQKRGPMLLVITALIGIGGGFGWWMAGNTSASVPPMAQANPVAPVAQPPIAVAAAPLEYAANTTIVFETNETTASIPAVEPEPLEIEHVAALEISPAPAPKPAPAVIKPTPKPAPITTAVATASSTAGTPVMNKTVHIPSPEEQATRHYSHAQQALADRDLVRAESALRAVLAIDAGHAKAAETLATLLIQQGQRDDATQILTAALHQTPAQPRLAMLQARLLADAGRDVEAVEVLQTAKAKGDADYQALLGTLQQRLGNDTQAAAAYRQALTSAPQRGIWWLGLGISLERSQQSADALSAYRNALRDTTLETQVTEYVRARIAALDSGRG